MPVEQLYFDAQFARFLSDLPGIVAGVLAATLLYRFRLG